MRIARLCAALAALTLAVGVAPAAADTAPATPPGVTLVALHFGHGSFGRSGGLFRRSPYGRGSTLFGTRRGRSTSLLHRIGRAVVIGYLLHLLFAGSHGGGFLLLLVIIALLIAHRRRRRARAYYTSERQGAWR